MGFGFSFSFVSASQTEPKSEAASVCPNRTDIGSKPKTFFFFHQERRCTGSVRGGSSEAGDEEMEDQVEMEETSTSNVGMLPGRGTFMEGTTDGTVTQARDSARRHRTVVNVSEDLLNRRIQDARQQQVHSRNKRHS